MPCAPPSKKSMNPATIFSTLFVDELTRLPLSGVVVCPGSRSTPLAVAFSRQQALPVYVHLDERSAAFFALGLALESGLPAAVLTTSGTAAAELHPAVLEADRAAVPLLLLTADRPPELRDSGANQTADQVKLYAAAVRWYAELPLPQPNPSERLLRHLRATADRAVAAALGLHGTPGPVHLNFPFRKPLEPQGDDAGLFPPQQKALHHAKALQQFNAHPPSPYPPASPLPSPGGRGKGGAPRSARRGGKGEGEKSKVSDKPQTQIALAPRAPTPAELDALAALMRNHRRGLILAGTHAAPSPATATRLLRLAAVTGYPLLADALSGVRFHPEIPTTAANQAEIIAGHPLFLAAGLPHVLPPEVVLLFGAAPVSNATLAFLENLPPETVVAAISPYPRWPDPAFRLAHWLVADPDLALEGLLAALPQSLPADAGWRQAWRQAEEATRRAIAAAPLTEGKLLDAIVAALPPAARLFVGNSLPVRHLDEYAQPAAKAVRVFANRGLSGIDGVVSSAAGVAAASRQPTVLVLGDLSMLHDLGGLLAVPRFGLRDFQIVVLNNDGGGIFQRLPIAKHEPPFTEMFRTPHGLNFAPAAAMYGLAYRAVEDPRRLPGVLQSAIGRREAHLIEVRTDAQAHHRARQRLLAALRGMG